MSHSKNSHNSTSITAILNSSHSSWPYWFKFYHNFLDCSVLLSEGEILNIFKAITSKTLLHKWSPSDHLTFFRDSFEYHSDSEKVFSGFASLLQNYPANLKSLDITFENCNGLTNKELELIAYGIKRHAGSLEVLRCRFRKLLNITDSGLKVFTEIITRNVKKLKEFSVHLGISSKITDKGLGMLITKAKSYLKDLKVLAIEMPTSGRSITDKGSQAIARSLSFGRFRKLRDLCVDFSFCRYMGDSGLEVLGVEIGKSLTGLERLECGFEGCFNITDKGLGGFVGGIGKRLGVMKSFSVNFARCKEITNGGVCIMMVFLKLYGRNLGCIGMNFGSCHQIDDDGLKGVVLERRGFGKLKELKVNFSGCMRITGLGVNLFKIQVRRNLGSVDLVLDLSNCGGYSEGRIEEERGFEFSEPSLPIPHIPDFDIRDVEFPPDM